MGHVSKPCEDRDHGVLAWKEKLRPQEPPPPRPAPPPQAPPLSEMLPQASIEVVQQTECLGIIVSGSAQQGGKVSWWLLTTHIRLATSILVYKTLVLPTLFNAATAA